MTLPKQVKLKLIEIPSLKVAPVDWVFFDFSEPAKSTRFSLPFLIKGLDPSTSIQVSMTYEKIQWDRDDVSFILVAVTCLLLEPSVRSL